MLTAAFELADPAGTFVSLIRSTKTSSSTDLIFVAIEFSLDLILQYPSK
jgi:hypothetical protein